jgi:hypothetical protein
MIQRFIYHSSHTIYKTVLTKYYLKKSIKNKINGVEKHDKTRERIRLKSFNGFK